MSQFIEVEVQCPVCKTKGKVKMWPALNSKEDAVEKELLLTNHLFDFDCPKWHANTRIAYVMDYSDMEHDVVIHLTTPQEVAKLEQYINTIENNIANITISADSVELNDFSSMLSRKKHRIVTNQNSLIEKAIIFNAELDDRIIEMIKAIYGTRFAIDKPDLHFDEILFLIDADKKHCLQLIEHGNGKSYQIFIQDGLYDELKQEFEEKLQKDNAHIIDFQWARLQFK